MQTNERKTILWLATLLQRDTVKTLSMTDPWGTLVALGTKRIETRSWPTPYRGPLAIHIAKTLPPQAAACCDTLPFSQALEAGGYRWQPERGHNAWGLPLGQIVAIVWLDEVQRITPTFQVVEPERSFGLFVPGRYAWRFSQVYRLTTPLPARGALGVWEWHPPSGFWCEIQAEYDRVREAVQR
ncbi:MAG: ASCH domain-containing protein [Ktedonobacteraceae bacterium]